MLPGSLLLSFIVLIVGVSLGLFSFFNQDQPELCKAKSRLNYWFIDSDHSGDNSSLSTVKRVLGHLGHEAVNGSSEEWDVMWSIDFPFERFPQKLKNLKPHQIINHFPAITFLTNKMFLSMSFQSKYIPVAFEFPRFKNEFLYHYRLNPHKQFVVKHFDVGGIKLVPFNDIDYFLGRDQYMQEFINPYLIDGHAFDFGVYVLITSIDPIRIYRWKSEILLRFCAEPYQPFDANNVNKYVVGESHIPHWEMPSLKNVTETFGFSALKAFNHYLKNQEQEVDELWEQIDDAIVSITLSKVDQINRHVNYFYKGNSGQKQKFFELLRYDFIIDDKFDLHLLEVNLNPDLRKHDRLKSMYEKLIYNTLSVVGITNHNDMKPSTIEESLMFSAPKDITVNPEDCKNCENTCTVLSCQLCMSCISNETLQSVHQSYREHQRKGEMKRLFPSELYAEESYVKKLSDANKLSMKWFKAKCDDDYEWC